MLSTEISPKRLQLMVCSSIFAFDLLEVLFLSIYFFQITKDYIYFYYFALVSIVLMTVASFFVPESPVFLYEKGLCEQARMLINRMSKMNGATLHEENWVLDKEEILGYAPAGAPELMVTQGQGSGGETEERIRKTLKPIGKGALTFATSGDLSPPSTENPFALMKEHPQIFVNMIILTTCWISISFNKYLISFHLKHIKGNIFINAGLSPFADIIGHFLCVPVQAKTSTKFTFMVSFLLSFVFGAALIFIETDWIIPIMIVFSKI